MSKRKEGYTLIEVIIVLAIILLLGGVTITLSYEIILLILTDATVMINLIMHYCIWILYAIATELFL